MSDFPLERYEVAEEAFSEEEPIFTLPSVSSGSFVSMLNGPRTVLVCEFPALSTTVTRILVFPDSTPETVPLHDFVPARSVFPPQEFPSSLVSKYTSEIPVPSPSLAVPAILRSFVLYHVVPSTSTEDVAT